MLNMLTIYILVIVRKSSNHGCNCNYHLGIETIIGDGLYQAFMMILGWLIIKTVHLMAIDVAGKKWFVKKNIVNHHHGYR